MNVVISAVALLLLVVTAACAPLPPPVGVEVLEVKRTEGRTVKVGIFYETDAEAPAEVFSPKPIFHGPRLAFDGPYASDDEKRPLVLVSHGYLGLLYSQAWLARDLVDEGYLVASLEHPGTRADDQTLAGRVRLWDRTEDVRATLDELLANPVWGARIDAERVAYVGHSLGGLSALQLAGGSWSYDAQLASCREHNDDVYCGLVVADGDAEVSREGERDDHADPRIDAHVVLAPGPSAGVDETTLSAATAPFLVLNAEHDEVLSRRHGELYARLPRAEASLLPYGHFAFVPECNLLGRALQGDRLCSRADERSDAHVEVSSRVRDFLARHLPVDEAAQ